MKIEITGKYLGIVAFAFLVFLMPAQAQSITSQLDKAPQTTKDPRLACLTAYWPSESPAGSSTSRHQSSTGVYLRQGHCAVDSRVIPYGSMVVISGVGQFLAVDTGSAVISRRAARKSGRTSNQRNALVVDIFFSSQLAAKHFTDNGPKFATITWYDSHSPIAAQ